MIDVRKWRVRLARLTTRVLTALGLLFLIVSLIPVDNWWATILAGQEYTETGDVLIVLSGSMGDDGSMGRSSYLRATYAGRAYLDGGFKEVLIAGGPADQAKVPVSIAMGEYLKFQGVPSEAIHLETRSQSTRENALYSIALLNTLPGRKVLLTSDYHMFRARRVFARLGLQVFPQPVPDVIKSSGQWWMRWPAFLDLLRETAKIGYYWARGWI